MKAELLRLVRVSQACSDACWMINTDALVALLSQFSQAGNLNHTLPLISRHDFVPQDAAPGFAPYRGLYMACVCALVPSCKQWSERTGAQGKSNVLTLRQIPLLNSQLLSACFCYMNMA